MLSYLTVVPVVVCPVFKMHWRLHTSTHKGLSDSHQDCVGLSGLTGTHKKYDSLVMFLRNWK